MNSFLFLFTLFASMTSASAQAQNQFSTRDSLGRLVYVKDGSTKHYMGYFCLERSKEEGKDRACLKAQFGMGEDIIRGVDFLGNPSADQGSWKPIGPIFTPESGKDFYNSALQSKAKEEFLEIWQDIWTREGYNWSSDPVKVSKSTWNNFLTLFENQPTTQLDGTEIIPEKDLRKFLSDSKWPLHPWSGSLRFSSNNTGLRICFAISTYHKYETLPNYENNGYNGGKCYSENEKTLTYDVNTQSLRALGVDGNMIVIKVMRKEGITWLDLDMTIPAGSFYTNKDDDNKQYYYYAAQHVNLKLIRE